jgi:energy-coupling factor transporter ATP-binding protein EcfA2
MKLTRSQLLFILAALTIIIAVITNIATEQVPESLKGHLWMAWPLLAVLAAVFLLLTYLSSREESKAPSPKFSLKDYYAALKRRYQSLDLDALTPPQKEEYLQLRLRSIFVEQSVRENPPPVELPKEVWEKLQREGEIHPDDLPEGVTPDDLRQTRELYYKEPQQLALDALTMPKHRHAVVLGDPGSGKSTLARYILLSLAEHDPDSKLGRAFKNHIPLLIELRILAGLREEHKCDTFLEYLEYLGKTEGWHLTEAALHQHLETDGRAVVIFDGLDEIFDPEDREQIARRIAGFANDYPKARVLVTSRVIGYRRAILTEAGFSHFTLQDLDENQVAAFVGRWYELALSSKPDEARARTERIMHSFRQSASIRQLAGNPMLLTIMAIIGKHQELPRERWKLYDHAASVLIQHWDVQKHLEKQRIEADFIGEEDKKELLRRIAYRMQSGAGGLAGNYIHREQLQAEFETYLVERYAQPRDRAVTISRSMIDQFRTRNFILSLYGANVYGFVHRAFLEYFCATAFVYKFEKSREMTPEQLNAEVYGAHWHDESWHEVLRLICGMIDERFAGNIIDFLVDNTKNPLPEDLDKNPPWNIALAVQCLAEVRNLTILAAPAERVLRAVFDLFKKAMESINYSIETFVDRQITPAAEAIGANWPNREVLAGMLKDYKPPRYASMLAEGFGKFVAAVGAGADVVHAQLIENATSGDTSQRTLTPFALAKGWRTDPQTFNLLQHQASADEDGPTRWVALKAIVEYFDDVQQGTFTLLLNRAANDSEELVRVFAIQALSDKKSGDLELLPVFIKAAEDPSMWVRFLAIHALNSYRTDPRIKPALYKCVVDGDSMFVRASAYRTLINLFGDDPQTLELLSDRAVSDPDALRRFEILDMLATRRRDVRVMELLRERARNDPDELVRSRAAELVEGLRDEG